MLKAITREGKGHMFCPSVYQSILAAREREMEEEVQEGGGTYLGVDQKGRSLKGRTTIEVRGGTHTYTTSIVASTI